MQRREWIARIVLLIILIGLPAGIFMYEVVIQPHLTDHRVIDITASVSEAGGFQPNAITVQAGETVTLRFHSVDVTHGVAIGPALGIDLGDIEPGHVKEVTLTFDTGGTYTFYCNSWCSVNHWRMRGIIDVVDPVHPNPTPQRDPIIDALATEGINIDADSSMSSTAPATLPASLFVKPPSAQRGAMLIDKVNTPSELRDLAWRRTHTPSEALQMLIALNPAATQTDLDDVVAYLWIGNVSPDLLANSASLYAKNCAACHGESGDGKGPAASQIVKTPVAFADLLHMSTRRGDVLYAKIRRGGMGTNMPNFGTVFTPDETWALVDYLWSLAFRVDIP
jgi:plastocyanin/mono/diheme cytochrome c family protein